MVTHVGTNSAVIELDIDGRHIDREFPVGRLEQISAGFSGKHVIYRVMRVNDQIKSVLELDPNTPEAADDSWKDEWKEILDDFEPQLQHEPAPASAPAPAPVI